MRSVSKALVMRTSLSRGQQSSFEFSWRSCENVTLIVKYRNVYRSFVLWYCIRLHIAACNNTVIRNEFWTQEIFLERSFLVRFKVRTVLPLSLLSRNLWCFEESSISCWHTDLQNYAFIRKSDIKLSFAMKNLSLPFAPANHSGRFHEITFSQLCQNILSNEILQYFLQILKFSNNFNLWTLVLNDLYMIEFSWLYIHSSLIDNIMSVGQFL